MDLYGKNRALGLWLHFPSMAPAHTQDLWDTFYPYRPLTWLIT